jgi:hypothetical protein
MAIAAVVAARVLLLLSGAGGFVLSLYAIQSPELARIGVCVVYDLGIVLPIAWLYLRSSSNV